uniref:hypothetical protein n=1 Tax=Methyloprofundus sp. TaxID=2020875 RepID=UPI00262FD48F
MHEKGIIPVAIPIGARLLGSNELYLTYCWVIISDYNKNKLVNITTLGIKVGRKSQPVQYKKNKLTEYSNRTAITFI